MKHCGQNNTIFVQYPESSPNGAALLVEVLYLKFHVFMVSASCLSTPCRQNVKPPGSVRRVFFVGSCEPANFTSSLREGQISVHVHQPHFVSFEPRSFSLKGFLLAPFDLVFVQMTFNHLACFPVLDILHVASLNHSGLQYVPA